MFQLLGISLKTPINVGLTKIIQYFTVQNKGKVYASYQHAKQNISLEDSQKFNINYNGLGNVFYFNDLNIRNVYDVMSGVEITL